MPLRHGSIDLTDRRVFQMGTVIESEEIDSLLTLPESEACKRICELNSRLGASTSFQSVDARTREVRGDIFDFFEFLALAIVRLRYTSFISIYARIFAI
ncbi:hypothetical protein KIN20_037258 [Parelaphostrongylus tenuis]|uniref:Uncharacterized protein n=1 Tax=Parelaphostrongylus tenuis TaxID=148309 RepID=A0AAD5RED0_PARTN|nr:hypothetical protein KIN20_037258 [Parelaphostrongylus tenuis]